MRLYNQIRYVTFISFKSSVRWKTLKNLCPCIVICGKYVLLYANYLFIWTIFKTIHTIVDVNIIYQFWIIWRYFWELESKPIDGHINRIHKQFLTLMEASNIVSFRKSKFWRVWIDYFLVFALQWFIHLEYFYKGFQTDLSVISDYLFIVVVVVKKWFCWCIALIPTLIPHSWFY